MVFSVLIYIVTDVIQSSLCACVLCVFAEEGEREGEGEGEGEVCLPPQERKRGGRSKKVKKKIRNVVRLAEVFM